MEGETFYIRGRWFKAGLREAHHLDKVAETQIKAIKNCRTEKDTFWYVTEETAQTRKATSM